MTNVHELLAPAREALRAFEIACSSIAGAAERARRDQISKQELRALVVQLDEGLAQILEPVRQMVELVAWAAAENEGLRERVRELERELEEVWTGGARH